MGRFEQSIRLRRTGAGRHQAQIGPEWCIAGAPNGGYLMALCLQALGACCARPHPVAATAHYLARSSPGQASVQSRLLRRGRALETAEAVLSQGSAQVKCVGTFGDLGEIDGPEFIEQPAPEWPAPEDCVPVANLFPPAAGLAPECRHVPSLVARFASSCACATARSPEMCAQMLWYEACAEAACSRTAPTHRTQAPLTMHENSLAGSAIV